MEERQKKIIVMRALVASTVFFIFIFWLLNIPKVWEGNNKNINDNSEINDLKEEINSSLADIEKKLEKIEEKSKLSSDADVLLEGVLENAEEKTGSSSTSTYSIPTPIIPSSTPTSTPTLPKGENNCPAYINCMPSIGDARPCQIPAGCEDITQIAY